MPSEVVPSIDLAGLLAAFRQTDAALAAQAAKAVNISLTLRNWCFGFYLAEFEQNGTDRAQYGTRLVEEVSARLGQAGLAGVAPRSLRQYRQFYQAYPGIWQTASAKSLSALLPVPIWQTLSAKLPALQIRETPSPESTQPAVPAQQLVERLSFSHFAELLQLDDPLQRAFYEVEMGLNDSELAFYDALADNASAVERMGDETLKTIAREVTETLRNSTTVDWQKRESVRARLRNLVRITLRRYKYPPEMQEDAIRLVQEQAERLSDAWTR